MSMNLVHILNAIQMSSGIHIRLHTQEGIQHFGNQLPVANPIDEMIPSALDSGYSPTFSRSPELVYGSVVRIDGQEDFISIGPVFLSENSYARTTKILTSMKENKDKTNIFYHWLQTNPIYDLPRLMGLISLIHLTVNGYTETPHQIRWPITASHDYSNLPSPKYIEDIDISYEARLLLNVEHGNINEVRIQVESLNYDYAPMLYLNKSLHQYRIEFIKTATLVSRAAIKGGISYPIAMALCDDYIGRVNSISTAEEVLEYIKQMILDFTLRTSKSRQLTTDSIVVKRIDKLIQGRIYERLSTSSIAKELNLNASYISKHFKEETGLTITNYIQTAKIEEAKKLLLLHQSSITEIYTQLHFSSQSYFQQVFKKLTGMTPIEFQKQS